jgi:hypothetical protein
MNPLKHFLDSCLPKKYHWYEVRYIYSTKDGVKVFDYVTQIGLTDKSTILKRRTLKKIGKPIHMQSKKLRKYLCNGGFAVEVLCYLGKFNKPKI